MASSEVAEGTASGLRLGAMKVSRTLWAATVIALSAFCGVLIGLTIPQAISHAETLDRSVIPWIGERLFGFMSYWVIAASVVYGLLLSTQLLDRVTHQHVKFALHKDLAAIGFGLAGIHGTILVLDNHFQYTVLNVFIPGMSPYSPFWVGVGQIALYLLAIVVASWYLRRRIGVGNWRVLHGITFAAFIFATLHGLLAGTDSTEAWAIWIYAIATTLVVFLMAYRIYIAFSAFRMRHLPPRRY